MLLVTVGVSVAAAKPVGDAPAPACTVGRDGALNELGCEVARVSPRSATVVVASAAIKSDAAMVDPKGLAERLVRLVAGRIGASAIAVTEPMTLGGARLRAARSGLLVYLAPALLRGELEVTADVYPVVKSFWARVRNPMPQPVAHVFAKRSIDAEVARFLPAIPLVSRVADDKVEAPRGVVAMACGDVDKNGSLELVVVGRQSIRVGRIRERRFVTERSVDWAAVAPVAPAPLREPIGGIALGDGFVDIGMTDRATAVRLDGRLARMQELPAVVPWAAVGCAKRNGLSIGLPAGCEPRGPAPPKLVADVETDAIAGAWITSRKGAVRQVFAWREPKTGLVWLGDHEGRRARVDRAGAQLAVGDLDLDGQPELVTSVDTLDPKSDGIVVRTWKDGGEVVSRYSRKIAGVSAVAICPPVDQRSPPIIVATNAGLSVIR